MLRESKAFFLILKAYGNVTTVASGNPARRTAILRPRALQAGEGRSSCDSPASTTLHPGTAGVQRGLPYWNMKWEPDLANTNTPTLPPFREHPLSTQSASLPRRQHYTTQKTVKSQREVVGETSVENSRYLKKMASSFYGY